MKAILHTWIYRAGIYCPRIFALIVAWFIACGNLSAQCGAGFTRDTLNWDNMDFLHRSGFTYGGNNPVTGLPFVTAAMVQTQNFTLSNNRITFTNTNSLPVGSTGVFYADITTHTGESGSFGNGEDVKFMPAASPASYSISFSFQNPVQDVKFSLYDVDVDQRVTVVAQDGVTSKNITMAKVSGAILTINGSGTTSANAKASSTGAANSSTDGTVNVTISGQVTSFTITVSETTIKTNGPASGQDDGGFYLSDISACFTNPSFPVNYYYSYTQPFTNQPAYFLANPQNLSVYMIDAATGNAEHLFTDPGIGGNKMNSLAYDPVNKWLYYVMDNQPSVLNTPINRKLKKYDFNTETISDVIPDLYTFGNGIPTFIQGVEFGGAAFYNGSLYLGIEGSDGISYSTGAESIVWKIDFDGSGNPTTFSQAMAILGDDGSGNPLQDWGDFIIKDGILITHATGSTAGVNYYTHYDLQTGTAIKYTGDATTAGQMGQIFDGTLYRVKNDISVYNNNGTVGSSTPITVNSCSPAWIGNAGDASDPFKPKCDFGDAPSTYDPDPLAPAANQKACNNSTLRIGSTWGDEWSKYTSTDASGDDEEDGISTVTILLSDGSTYNHVQEVTVLNNTGATAYLGGWLDYNADGIFQTSEGVIVSVPSSPSPQVISLAWNSLTVTPGTPNTFLRVRLYSGVLTTSDGTGWLSDGETEDYPVLSNAIPLLINLLDFNATLTTNKDVVLNWKAYTDNDAKGFEIERSADQNNWVSIGWIDKSTETQTANYNLTDNEPLLGRSYYRLKMVEKSGSSKYSNIRIINLDKYVSKLKIYPNPVRNEANISFNSKIDQQVSLIVRSISGAIISNKKVALTEGENKLNIDLSGLKNGIYLTEIITRDDSYYDKFILLH